MMKALGENGNETSPTASDVMVVDLSTCACVGNVVEDGDVTSFESSQMVR